MKEKSYTDKYFERKYKGENAAAVFIFVAILGPILAMVLFATVGPVGVILLVLAAVFVVYMIIKGPKKIRK